MKTIDRIIAAVEQTASQLLRESSGPRDKLAKRSNALVDQVQYYNDGRRGLLPREWGQLELVQKALVDGQVEPNSPDQGTVTGPVALTERQRRILDASDTIERLAAEQKHLLSEGSNKEYAATTRRLKSEWLTLESILMS